MKKMRVAFDIDVTTFLALLAQGNSSMRIEILGDAPAKLKEKPPSLRAYNGHKPPPKQLAAPKKRRRHIRVRAKGQPTIRAVLLAFLAKNKDRAIHTKEFEPVVTGIGAATNSVSPQLVQLKSDGFIKRTGAAEYQITARGLNHVG